VVFCDEPPILANKLYDNGSFSVSDFARYSAACKQHSPGAGVGLAVLRLPLCEPCSKLVSYYSPYKARKLKSGCSRVLRALLDTAR